MWGFSKYKSSTNQLISGVIMIYEYICCLRMSLFDMSGILISSDYQAPTDKMF